MNENFNWVLSNLFNDVVPNRVVRNSPKINAFLESDIINVEVFYPGVKKEDFKVRIEEELLIISGEFETKKEDMLFREFVPTNFSRRFTIPEEVKKKDISATYEDGVLKIQIPIDKKKEKEKKFEVTIE